jgi:hypothetical protein
MSDETNEPSSDVGAKSALPDRAGAPAALGYGPESQRERWVKYGSNVGLSIVVVVVLAGLVIWLSQAQGLHLGKMHLTFRKSIDVTSDSSQSLKPQTLAVIGDLKTPIKLVSLYPKLKQEKAGSEQDFQTPVVDLLDKYREKGKNIEVEVIDPVNEPTKLDQWINELKEKYGSNTKAYHDLLATDLPKTLEQFNKLASAEAQAMDKQLQEVRFKDEDQVVPFRSAYNTVAGFPQTLDEVSKGAQEELQKQFPDYKAYTATLKTLLGTLSTRAQKVRSSFEKMKDDKDVPDAARTYAADSIPHFDEMKKLADDLVAKIDKLGELKLDEVRRVLFGGEEGEAPPPAVAVMGPNDIKLIQFNDVWKSGENFRAIGPATGQPKLRFAGEQQTTSAIIALSENKKQKICFLRAGGPSRLVGNFMQGGGDMSDIADRLRAVNFDVSEKDVAKDAQQPQMNQMPTPPDPSYEDIKDAVWVILDEPMSSQFGPTPPSPVLSEKLKEHLDEGGSAICLIGFHGDALATAIKDWGISTDPEKIIVHERIDAPAAEGDDFVEEVRRQPFIFILNDYGDSPVTSPLAALDSALVPLCPVQAKDKPADQDVMTSILPIPQDPKCWATSKTETLSGRDATPPRFDPATDTAPPLFAGAIAEKKGKGRLVVIGCANFISNDLLRMPDPKLAKQKVMVARFPGNGELFTNSAFWCAHEDRMIALSPSALDTARIEPIHPALLNFLRFGLVLFALPLLSVALGVVVYQSRRA